ncbi:MAG: winged helix-turn-helix transcriptional regulator [Eubacterium sp.]|nr:winged helix-turn-helix transcriptional regulator [Eubacterium sp.]
MSALRSFENKTQLKEEIACEKLAFAGMEIDASKRLVYRGEKEVNITFTEFEILHLLARNPGRVFSKEQIYDIVWKESYSGDYNIIISHNRNIREKIEDNPSKPIYIHVETCVLLSRKAPDAEIKVRLDMSELDITSAESKAKVPQAGFFYTTKAGITASFVTVQNHPDYLLHIHSIERLID